jgi:lipopolysaccharide biosynthesis regulator YciM
MQVIPTKKQWKSWKFLSKFSFLTGCAGIVGLIIGLVSLFMPARQINENLLSINDNTSTINMQNVFADTLKINQIINNSTEYKNILEDIDQQKVLLKYIPKSEIIERQNAAQKLSDLKKQEKQYKQDIMELALKFTDIDINSERLSVAKQLFENGDVSQADSILNEADLFEEQTTLLNAEKLQQKTLENTRRNLEINANELIVKAHLTELNYELPDRFEQSRNYFQMALMSSRTPDNLTEYAQFLGKNNHLADALSHFKESLDAYEKLATVDSQTYEVKIANIHNSIAELYSVQMDLSSAETACHKALEIRKRLARENPKEYEPDFAEALSTLAYIQLTRNDFHSAEQTFMKILEIRKRLARSNPKEFEPLLAATYNHLATLYKNQNNYNTAEWAYNKSLTIRERLAKHDPLAHNSDLAISLNNLALLKILQEQSLEAEMYCTRALKIQERLATNNPIEHEPRLATTLINMGEVYSNLDDFPSSESAYKRALEIYSRFGQVNPQFFERNIAIALNNLALLYSKNSYFTKADSTYASALTIMERLAKKNPEKCEIELGQFLINYASLNMKISKEHIASIQMDRAEKIAAKYKTSPTAKSMQDNFITMGDVKITIYD